MWKTSMNFLRISAASGLNNF